MNAPLSHSENSLPEAKPAWRGYSVYQYQTEAMPVLLGWAVGSMVSGGLWLSSRSEWLKGFGSQFLAWGAIDGAIAAAGMKGATKKEGRRRAGEISSAEHSREAIQFERFVWLNVLLDLGYMLGGWQLARRSSGDARRQGMGWGILAQGAFLFIWDIFLASIAGRKRRAG